jgi:hypothetical protein
MNGYDVVTVDEDKIGHVVGEEGDFLIVEHGLLKSKNALPRTFAEVDEAAGVVRTTLSKEMVHDSPKLHNGDFDRTEVAEHYGLAEGFTDPPTRGLGDLEPDDPAFGEDGSLHARVAARKEVTEGGPLDEPGYSPGVTGGDRRRDYPRE